MKPVREIKGVYDDDLPKLLEKLGLKEDFEQGKIRCAFTNEVVSMDNFLGIFSDGQDIKFVCNNETARAKLAELTQRKND
ncbi:MAG TPA: hypothetical protein VI957_02805 [Candidatus Paceibacterota bacterium]